MKARVVAALGWIALAVQAPHAQAGTDFEVRSADGVAIHGESDTPSPRPRLAIILVPGTGGFDRNVTLGQSGTPRDMVFKDLAQRLVARGVAAIRYDVRGIKYNVPAYKIPDRPVLAKRTTQNMREDVAALYDWSRSPQGFGARCVGFFVHSEGMLHVARLAETGANAPAIIIGMGAAMDSPAATMRWQMTGRDADSLEMMDADHDGTVTNDEVRANIARTPSGVHGQLEPFLHPSGAWKREDIEAVRKTQGELYEKVKADVLAMPDAAPYPSPHDAFASYQWWKSWFIDERPAAEQLARWTSPVVLHYGELDSQTPAAAQIAAAKKFLAADRLRIEVHRNRGHTLGESALLGPIDEAIADKIAAEAAAMPCP